MDRRQQLIDALGQGLDQSTHFFRSLTAKQLSQEIYQDGARWTAQQVVAHFITIERSMQWLFRNILDGGEGSPRDFDVERFNSSQTAKLDGFSIGELIEQFQQVRRETISMVAAMSESDLDREGHHAFHGQGRLERFIQWAYEHAALHETEIKAVLKKSN